MFSNQLNFKFYETFYMVGDNSTTRGNGIKDKNYSGIVVIPKEYRGFPVQEIGQFAFAECQFITHVLIEAEIVQMDAFCFGSTKSLMSINIPKTVKFIGTCALTSYNRMNESVEADVPNSMGTLIVSFEEESQLQYIDVTPFGRKENIIINTVDDLSHIGCNESWYYSSSNFIIYSTKEFTSCRTNSTVVPVVDVLHDKITLQQIIKSLTRIPTCTINPKLSYSPLLFAIFIGSQ